MGEILSELRRVFGWEVYDRNDVPPSPFLREAKREVKRKPLVDARQICEGVMGVDSDLMIDGNLVIETTLINAPKDFKKEVNKVFASGVSLSGLTDREVQLGRERLVSEANLALLKPFLSKYIRKEVSVLEIYTSLKKQVSKSTIEKGMAALRKATAEKQ